MTARSHDCLRTETAAAHIPKPQTVPAPYVFSDYAQWERRPTSHRRPRAHTCVPLSLKQIISTETRRPSVSPQPCASNWRRQVKVPEQVSIKLLRVRPFRLGWGIGKVIVTFLHLAPNCREAQVTRMLPSIQRVSVSARRYV